MKTGARKGRGKDEQVSQVRGHMPVTVVLRSLRQEDSKFEASLGHSELKANLLCTVISYINDPLPPKKKARKKTGRDGEEED